MDLDDFVSSLESEDFVSISIIVLKYYSPTITHDKFSFMTFVNNWIVYLQDAKVVNENFIMCNGG